MLDMMDGGDLYAITAVEERSVLDWLYSDADDEFFDYLACNAPEESPMVSPFMADSPAESALDSGAMPPTLADAMATAVVAEHSATYGRTITTGVQMHSPCINNAGVNMSHFAHEGFTSSSPHDLSDRFDTTPQEVAFLNTVNIPAAAAAAAAANIAGAAGWVAGSAQNSTWSNTQVPAGSPQTHTASTNTSPVLSYGSTICTEVQQEAAAAAASKPKVSCRKRVRLAQQLKEQRKLQAETEVVSDDDNAKRRCVNGIFAQINAQAHQHMLLQQQQQQQTAVGVDYEQPPSQAQELQNTLFLTSSQLLQQQQMLQQTQYVQYMQPQPHLLAQELQQQLLQEQQYMSNRATVTTLQPAAQVAPRPDDFDEWLEDLLQQQQQPQQPQEQQQAQLQQEEQQQPQQQQQVNAAAAAVRGLIGVRRTRPDCGTFKAFIWCEGAGGKGGQVAHLGICSTREEAAARFNEAARFKNRAMPNLHRLNHVSAAAGQQDDSTLQDLTAGAKKNLVAWARSNGLEQCLCVRMEGGKWVLQWDLEALPQAKKTQ